MAGNTFSYGYMAGTLQTFTASTGGTYQITAVGAGGQGSTYASGGVGADLVADFTLTAGEKLTIVVGGYGTVGSGDGGGGGGGGSFGIETNTGSAATQQNCLLPAAAALPG